MTDNRHDMQKMQRDAENRIREMQKKADRAVLGSDMPPIPNFVRVDNRKQQSKRNQDEPPKTSNASATNNKVHRNEGQNNKGINLLKMFNFKNMKLDKDIMLIVVMILLLSSEDTDELLLMALVYIML